jgi:hypothetical protein
MLFNSRDHSLPIAGINYYYLFTATSVSQQRPLFAGPAATSVTPIRHDSGDRWLPAVTVTTGEYLVCCVLNKLSNNIIYNINYSHPHRTIQQIHRIQQQQQWHTRVSKMNKYSSIHR